MINKRIIKKFYRKHRMWMTYFIAAFLVGVLVGCFIWVERTKAQLLNPEGPKSNEKVIVIDLPNIYKPETPIEKEIQEVFGQYYPKAMLLLKGNGTPGACHENGKLNPNATNDNTTWGGVGKDWGVFQINDKWQGITHEGKAKQFLLDPHINIAIAWRLFVDSGYSFNLWTCGKAYGI